MQFNSLSHGRAVRDRILLRAERQGTNREDLDAIAQAGPTWLDMVDKLKLQAAEENLLRDAIIFIANEERRLLAGTRRGEALHG